MKLGYVIGYVPDVAAALDFYERAFGLSRRFLHESGTYGELDTGRTTLAFAAIELAAGNGVDIVPPDPSRPAPPIEVGLVTDDVAAAYDRATRAGAAAVAPPKAKPWGQTVAYVRDPNGFLVELCTPMG